MGVTGLWRLIEPSGKPVPLETLENKVLAVDISIWLHQAIKGFQDSKGAPLPNAHLLGIYHRVCKLLYFRIKPIFIFDGGVPALKKQTIVKRNQLKTKTLNEADKIQKQLISTLLKHSAINKVISEKAKASLEAAIKPSTSKTSSRPTRDEIFELPPMDLGSSSEEEGEEEEESTDSSPTKHWDLHTIDEKSPHFQSLPADVRHEILTELKETRKQSSWDRIHEIPKESGDFSSYQMKRLLKRYSVQVSLEEAEKEMGGHSLSLNELETLLQDQGVVSKDAGRRIASDENTRFFLIKDVKKALEEAKQEEERRHKKQIELETILESKEEECEEIEMKRAELSSTDTDNEDKNLQTAIQLSLGDELKKEKAKPKPSSDEDEDLQKAIQLSLECEDDAPKKSEQDSSDKTEVSFVDNYDLQMSTDSEEEVAEKANPKPLSSAKNYMMEYSGLTPNEIEKIIGINITKAGKIKPKPVQTMLKQIFESTKERKEKLISNQNKDLLPVICEEEKELNDQVPHVVKVTETQLVKESGDIENVDQMNEKSKLDVQKNDSHQETSVEEIKQKKIQISKEEIADNIIKLSKEVEIQKQKEEKPKAQLKNLQGNEIELMSDSDTSTDECMEVSTSSEIGLNTKPNSFEIVIKPSESLEDDIFGDIFSKPENEDLSLIKTLVDNNKREIDLAKSSHVLSKSPINLLPTISEEIDRETGENNNKMVKVLGNENDKELQQTKANKEKIVVSKEEIMVNREDISKSLVNERQSEVTNASQAQEGSSRLTRQQNKEKVISELLQSLKKTQDVRKQQNELESLDTLSSKQLEEIQENLLQEQKELIVEKSTKERLATNITDQMYQEAQELLQLFGVPYIIAPMEAEAQCAFLDSVNLTDGTITDDSDIWLFGGRSVYKNFFNQNKHVLEFRADEIQHHFKLTREQMVLLALLVGSDYTVGIQGIGPVTALEVLAAFPPKTAHFSVSHQELLSGLSEFRSWLIGEKVTVSGKATLRNKLKNVVFTENFPSYQVVRAYLDPKVDQSKEPFFWAKPDIVALTDFARAKFGWTRQKSEEILKPVMKRMEEKHIQKSIRDYFKTKFKVRSIEVEGKMSKRVQRAVHRMGKDEGDTSEEEKQSKETKSREKKGRKKKKDKEISKDIGELQKQKLEIVKENEEDVDDFRDENKGSKDKKEAKQKPKQKRTNITEVSESRKEFKDERKIPKDEINSNEQKPVLTRKENKDNITGNFEDNDELSENRRKPVRQQQIRRNTPKRKENISKGEELHKSSTNTENSVRATESGKTSTVAAKATTSKLLNKDTKVKGKQIGGNNMQVRKSTRNTSKTSAITTEQHSVSKTSTQFKDIEESEKIQSSQLNDILQKLKPKQKDNISKTTSLVMETDIEGLLKSPVEPADHPKRQDQESDACSSIMGTAASDDSQPSTSEKNLKRSKTETKGRKRLKAGDESGNVSDEEMKILRDTYTQSKSKVEQIRAQLMEQLTRSTKSPKEKREIIRDVSGPISPLDRLKTENIHRKDIIPQKEQDKLTRIRSRIKAAEVLRTSKKRSNKKKQKPKRVPHNSTHYLSESSSDDDKGK